MAREPWDISIEAKVGGGGVRKGPARPSKFLIASEECECFSCEVLPFCNVIV